ncbi:MAG: DUF881 domain-containing protein [Nocardioides sp.]
MPPIDHPSPGRALRRPSPWRVGTALVLFIGAGLLIISENSSGGTDLRPGRYTDLASLVSGESRRVQGQQARVAEISAEVESLTQTVRDKKVSRIQRQAAAVSDDAGLEPVTGAAVTIVLSDAPVDDINATNVDLNRFVVHQQDIQAVVNALWTGGAEAVTVQGQRIISTTGIKCEGNSVTLQGVPFPQPYVISGIGLQGGLLTALELDGYVARYRSDAANPAIGVGWDLSTQTVLTAPAYDGLLDLSYASVAR